MIVYLRSLRVIVAAGSAAQVDGLAAFRTAASVTAHEIFLDDLGSYSLAAERTTTFLLGSHYFSWLKLTVLRLACAITVRVDYAL
jgi:hypothetical protein